MANFNLFDVYTPIVWQTLIYSMYTRQTIVWQTLIYSMCTPLLYGKL